MARNLTEKITISFEKAALIRKMVGDIAIKQNKSFSSIVEKIVLNSLLPQNSSAKFVVENYLYADDGGIWKTLAVLFGNNAAGTECEAVHENLLPLVQFAREQDSFHNMCLTNDEGTLHRLKMHVNFVVQRLGELEENADIAKKGHYSVQKKQGRELVNQIENDPENLNLTDVYHLLLDSWDDLKKWTYTYRLLQSMSTFQKENNDTPERRMELVQIIKNVSDEW